VGVRRNEFDAIALYKAMDAQRVARGLSWREVAAQIWNQSADINRERHDHPISPSTLTGIAKRGDCTCQHALFVLRWLDRTPESFLRIVPVFENGCDALPSVGPGHRLRWNLHALYDALNGRRQARQLSWPEVAGELRCTEHQLTGLRTAKYAIRMTLAMQIVQWLEQPAAAFIYVAKW